MPRVAVNGINVYYEEHGSGAPLLLLHGFAATTAMWKPQVPPLSAGHRLILCDMRGHGQTDAPNSIKDYSVETVIEDLYRLLRHLGVERCIVGGLSLGGFISLNFHARHPEMVTGLVLADTGPGYRNPRGGMEQWNRTRLEIAEALVKKGVEGYLGSSSSREIARNHTAHGLANVSLGVMLSPLMPPLEEISVPTLVLCGDKDAPFLPATDYMHGHIRGSERVIIPNAGHAANLDQPQAFNAAVLGFLRRHGL